MKANFAAIVFSEPKRTFVLGFTAEPSAHHFALAGGLMRST